MQWMLRKQSAPSLLATSERAARSLFRSPRHELRVDGAREHGLVASFREPPGKQPCDREVYVGLAELRVTSNGSGVDSSVSGIDDDFHGAPAPFNVRNMISICHPESVPRSIARIKAERHAGAPCSAQKFRGETHGHSREALEVSVIRGPRSPATAVKSGEVPPEVIRLRGGVRIVDADFFRVVVQEGGEVRVLPENGFPHAVLTADALRRAHDDDGASGIEPTLRSLDSGAVACDPPELAGPKARFVRRLDRDGEGIYFPYAGDCPEKSERRRRRRGTRA